MTRKSKRDLWKDWARLEADDGSTDIMVSSEVVTLTSDGSEEPDVPPNATILPTESPVVTWYKLPSEAHDAQDTEE